MPKITRLVACAAAVVAGLLCSASLAEPPVQRGTRVMSFNIRYQNWFDGWNGWRYRRDLVARVIREHQTDIAGLQEARYGQILDLQQRLPRYAWFGVGREDGVREGEFVPIFYRQARYCRLDQGVFWLSPTPHLPGSKGWDAAITRLVTWVKLQDRRDGQTLFVFNTHFDHRGDVARRNSAVVLCNKMARIAADHPLVLTGDFNCLPDSTPIQMLTGDSSATAQKLVLSDSYQLAEQRYGPNSTWNGFWNVRPGRRIDFVFVRQGIAALSHRTIENKVEGRFPSDHLPVLVKLALP